MQCLRRNIERYWDRTSILVSVSRPSSFDSVQGTSNDNRFFERGDGSGLRLDGFEVDHVDPDPHRIARVVPTFPNQFT